MTKRLFDFDGYLLQFSSRVVSSEKVDGGYAIVLEETAFAPEGGGQRSDIGVLGGVNVIDVRSPNRRQAPHPIARRGFRFPDGSPKQSKSLARSAFLC